jgi:hypothetical protein
MTEGEIEKRRKKRGMKSEGGKNSEQKVRRMDEF